MIQEDNKSYYMQNREKKLAYQKLYSQKNKEKVALYQEEYYRKRKAKDPSYNKNGKPRIRPKKVRPPKPIKKPKLQPAPRLSKYEFQDASFTVTW
jgi:hypothetical protein